MGEVIRFPGSWVPDGLVEYMKRQGIPLTRENYIDLATDAEKWSGGPSTRSICRASSATITDKLQAEAPTSPQTD